MNIEEVLTSLKEIVAIRKERCDGFIESDGCLISTKRLETLLTAYEKEKEIVDKINKLNIPVDTLIAEFERLENLEDDRDILKKEIEELKEKNKPQPDCVEPVEKTEEMVNMRWVNHRFISKDKLKEMLSGYKKALKDVEGAIAILKSNLLVVADEKHKKEIEKELTFREEDRISKISIINLLEDLLEEE